MTNDVKPASATVVTRVASKAQVRVVRDRSMSGSLGL
jgi:hypothetical protein